MKHLSKAILSIEEVGEEEIPYLDEMISHLNVLKLKAEPEAHPLTKRILEAEKTLPQSLGFEIFMDPKGSEKVAKFFTLFNDLLALKPEDKILVIQEVSHKLKGKSNVLTLMISKMKSKIPPHLVAQLEEALKDFK